jgi:hypothetical protein
MADRPSDPLGDLPLAWAFNHGSDRKDLRFGSDAQDSITSAVAMTCNERSHCRAMAIGVSPTIVAPSTGEVSTGKHIPNQVDVSTIDARVNDGDRHVLAGRNLLGRRDMQCRDMPLLIANAVGVRRRADEEGEKSSSGSHHPNPSPSHAASGW